MLLSSPAFSTFLNELNTSKLSAAASNSQQQPQTQTPPQVQSQQQQQQQRQPSPKDVTPTPQQIQQLQQSPLPPQDNNLQVGMTSIPEPSMDFSLMDSVTESTNSNSSISSWGVGMDFGFTAQVFAVGSLPDGPSGPDAAALAGKPASDEVDSLLGLALPIEAPAKDDVPAFESMPQPLSQDQDEDEDEAEADSSALTYNHATAFDEADPAFALFVDTPAPAAPKAAAATLLPAPEDRAYLLFGTIEPAKAFARLHLVVGEHGRDAEAEEQHEQAQQQQEQDDDDDGKGVVSAAVMARFERLCCCLDAASERIAAVTAHL